MVLRYVPRFMRMADDFDESAAVSPGQAIRELQASLGGASDDSDEPVRPAKTESVIPGTRKPAAAAPTAPKDDKGGKAKEDEPPAEPDQDDDDETLDPDEKTESKPEGTGKPAAKEDDTSEPPKTKFGSVILDRIMAKYGNDPDKYAQAVFEQQNSLAKMHEKLEALEARLTAEEPEDPEQHPDVLAIDSDLTQLNTDYKEHGASQADLTKRGEELRLSIARLEGRLEDAPEERKAEIQVQIEAKKERLDTLKDKWVELEKDKKRIAREFKQLEGKRADRIKAIKDSYEEEQKQATKSKEWEKEQKSTFNAAINDLTKQYVLSDEDHQYLRDLITAEALVFLRGLDPKGPAVDLAKYVNERAAVHAAKLKFAKKQEFTKRSEEKRAAVRQSVTPRTPGPRTPPAANPPKRLSVAERAQAARIHAAKVLGG